MSLLVDSGISQCMKFYCIQDDEASNEIGPDKDFFVGMNRSVTLTIQNGSTIHLRDMVILGQLEIRSSDFTNSFAKGSLVARNVFVAGKLSLNYVNTEWNNKYIASNVKKFNQELQDIVMDWLDYQKESAEKMGLKSILI